MAVEQVVWCTYFFQPSSTTGGARIIVAWPSFTLAGLLLVDLAHVIIVDLEKVQVQHRVVDFFT